MTINFPKFPNNRRDKNRPIDPNMAVTSPLDDISADSTLPTGDNPAHNRSHQDMLTQTDQLQSDTLTEAQRALLKKRLKSHTLPTQKTKSLPLMPILLGLILLAGGVVLGYMYQAYTQPPAPVPAPISTKAAPVATPATPQATATMPASSVTGNTVPVTTPPAPAIPSNDKPTVAVASNPTSPTPAPKPTASDAIPMPPPINSDSSPSGSNTNNNATANLTNPPPTVKPAPTEAVMPANPINNQPTTASDVNVTAKPSNPPAKNTRSYDDFVKSSENAVFIEPPNHK